MRADDEAQAEFLLVIHSQDREALGLRHELAASSCVVTVGRGSDNTIVIRADRLSRCHARFEKRADRWWVLDCESTNGTFVNGDQVTATSLRHGDNVDMGGGAVIKFTNTRRIVETEYSASPFDGLTGAYNRRHLLEQTDRELRDPARARRPLTLLLIDIDHFKRLNDTYGHEAGDDVLRHIVSIIKRHSPSHGVVARCAGDELALLLPATDRDAGSARAEAIRAEIGAHALRVGGHKISVTVSIGVAQANDETRTAEDLTRSAEQNVYAAKCGGRDRVVA